MLDKSKYQEFYDYLQEGVIKIIQHNRENLEENIRASIDLKKSEKIIKKHRKEGEVYTVSPEMFVALSLIDEIPPNADLRLSPIFELDGVTFKKDKTVIKTINKVKVSYTEKIRQILKLQLSPDVELEMSRSGGYANNIIQKLRSSERAYRGEIKKFRMSITSRIDYLANVYKEPSLEDNPPSAPGVTDNERPPQPVSRRFVRKTITPRKNNNSLYLNTIITCTGNIEKSFGRRLTLHKLQNLTYRKRFCSEFIKQINKFRGELTADSTYKIMYISILNILFPKLSAKQKEKIFDISVNVATPLRYRDISNIIATKYIIYPQLCEYLEKNRTTYEFDIERRIKVLKNRIPKKEKKITVLEKEILSHQKELSKREAEIEKKKSEGVSELVFMGKEGRKGAILRTEIRKTGKLKGSILKKERQITGLKDDFVEINRKIEYLLSKKSVLKELFLNLDSCLKDKGLINMMRGEREEAYNNHSFFNLIIFTNRYRYILNNRAWHEIDTKYEFGYTEFIDFCKELIDLYGVRKKANKYPTAPINDLYSEFYDYVKTTRLWGKFVNEDDFDKMKFKKLLNERILKLFFPQVNDYQLNSSGNAVLDEHGNHVYTKTFVKLMNEYSMITDFCNTESAWNSYAGKNKLYEITKGIALTNIGNIGGANFLNYLFKEQEESNFFDSVESVLFHKNLVVVSRNGVLSGVMPSDAYRLFALNKGQETEAETEDLGKVQETRFLEILNNVIHEKGEEYFENQSGNAFIDELGNRLKIRFIKTIEAINSKYEAEEHTIDMGSIGSFAQECFTSFLKERSVIFPAKIPEIYLTVTAVKKRKPLPESERELFFYIEKLREDRSMDVKYCITYEDLHILGRSSRYYSTVLTERAFSVVFNKYILNNEALYAEFKSTIDSINIELAKKYFAIRGMSVTESRLLRRVFIKNGLQFLENSGDLQGKALDFMNGMFFGNKLLN